MPHPRSFRNRYLLLLLLLAVLAGLGGWIFTSLGRWLVDADPLQHARAIVVLSGLPPYRAMGAADLYRRGWAPEVWITTGNDRGARQTFERMGIRYISERDYTEQVLEKEGVPGQAIRILPTPIRNTAEELTQVISTLRQEGGDRVILVTSPPHTRRAKTIWHILTGDHPQAIVQYDAYEEYDSARWWRITSEGDDVTHELLGLLNAWAGFMAHPKR